MNYQDIVYYSKLITKKYGSNYYYATSLFPEKIREAVYVYYAWTRIPDEYVDGGLTKFEANKKLAHWKHEWLQASTGQKQGSSIHNHMHRLFLQYKVPLQYAEDFLFAMQQDISQVRYTSYNELEKYTHGSAVVVGFTMLCFFGLYKKNLLPGARALGQAMQLINFLRDIREDVDDLGRIYIPQEDMDRYSVLEEDIIKHVYSDNFKRLMKFEIDRCRALYKKAWPAIEKLPWRIKFPIRIATRNYEGVLKEIEKADYDIWNTRHGLSKIKKLVVLIRSLFV